MDKFDYISFARSFGYEIRFTGIGMAYIVIGDVMLTEVMDKEKAENELMLIGMAAMADTVREMVKTDRA